MEDQRMTAIGASPKPATRNEVTSRPRRASRRKLLVFGGIIVVLVVAAVVATGAGSKSAPPAVAPATSVPALSAHGTIEPVAQATVATISGGVVRSVAVKVGQNVTEQQKIADIASPGQTETVVAPWAGTVMGLNVQRGDTVMPGAVVATVGDLSRYQVRTTDVDEYLIGQIRAGQQVSMTVEALDGRRLDGTVDTVALVQQSSATGVTNYPVVIRLSGNDPDLRPGMSVRVVFSRGQ